MSSQRVCCCVHSSSRFVRKSFCWDGIAAARFAAVRSSSRRTETPRFGLPFRQLSSSSQSSPSSSSQMKAKYSRSSTTSSSTLTP